MGGCAYLSLQIEDLMNQQPANSSFANNSSAISTVSPAATPAANPAAPAETPLARATPRKPPAKANARKAALPNKNANKNDDRCRHYTVAGRRCRHTVLDRASGLCFRHMGRPFQPTDEDLSSTFVGLSGFESAVEIHSFLAQLTLLLVQNRVSTRRAAILAYLGQTLLRTLPALDEELNPDNDHIFFDLPRPKRDDDISPERAFVDRMAELGARCETPVAPDGYDGWTSSLDKSK